MQNYNFLTAWTTAMKINLALIRLIQNQRHVLNALFTFKAKAKFVSWGFGKVQVDLVQKRKELLLKLYKCCLSCTWAEKM